jgi:hypothetical protein
MNVIEHLLTTLAEECNEVAKDVSKALRFGVQDIEPGKTMTNSDRIVAELVEVMAMAEMLEEAGVIAMPKQPEMRSLMTAKKVRVQRFMEYARQKGTLIADTGEA